MSEIPHSADKDSATKLPLRHDLRVIAGMVPPDARVLDVGCGDGALLDYLTQQRSADARGMELSQSGVNACVARGLAVIQGDADTDLRDYPGDAFDYVILSQTLQAVHRPREVIRQMLRIGRRAIVSFPNFGNWRVRWYLLRQGRMPMTGTISEPWYRTANIHLCTIRDFVELCGKLDVVVEHSVTMDEQGRPTLFQNSAGFSNLFGAQGVFLIKKSGS